MTELKVSDASPASAWDALPWKKFHALVFRLHRRIAKAERVGDHGKVKALQWTLTHSFAAKALAVRRVTQNRGGKTPGVDKRVWKTPEQKMQAISHLNRRGYKTKPLRRIYIPKKDGRQRPLSIPTMLCRAQQALHLLALEPIVEERADPGSYGFRRKRSAADAMEHICRALATRVCAPWVLDADIESCFDKLSHTWIQDNIPMDKRMLKKWLKAGYIDQKAYHRTEAGVPQGGLISPAILVLALSGLESAAKNCYYNKRKGKVNVITYADDFIITGATREVLEDHVKPAVEAFLKERGLRLSIKKTKITHIDEGFDFLGFSVRKYKGKLLMKPSKASIKAFYADLKKTVKSHPTATTQGLIHMLNPKLLGWAYYFRGSCASKTFGTMDHRIFKLLWRWVHRRHSRKSAGWKRRKYFRSRGYQNWVFTTKVFEKDKAKDLDLLEMGSIKIRRHIQVRIAANPFDPKFTEYFKWRDLLRKDLREKDCKRQLKYLTDPDTAGLDLR